MERDQRMILGTGLPLFLLSVALLTLHLILLVSQLIYMEVPLRRISHY